MCKCFLQVSSINRAVFIALSFCYGAELPLVVTIQRYGGGRYVSLSLD